MKQKAVMKLAKTLGEDKELMSDLLKNALQEILEAQMTDHCSGHSYDCLTP